MKLLWTRDEKRELARLWKLGLSLGEIGKKMGKSKNAVAGAAHRAKLPKRPSPIIGPAVIKYVPSSEKLGCRWIEGDAREQLHAGHDYSDIICGKPVLQYGSMYCPTHHARAWIRREKKQPRAEAA